MKDMSTPRIASFQLPTRAFTAVTSPSGMAVSHPEGKSGISTFEDPQRRIDVLGVRLMRPPLVHHHKRHPGREGTDGCWAMG